MNKQQFLEEAYKYIDSSYKEFEEYRKVVKEIFSVFHNICEKNNVCYYMAFGSLLGLIRDGDMVPWDSDIDVVIDIKEIDVLRKVLKEQLGEEYYFESNYDSKHFGEYMLRVGKKGYNLSHVHVDVFFMFSVPNSEKAQSKIRRKVRKLIRLRNLKCLRLETEDSKNKIKFTTKKFAIRIFKLIPFYIINSSFNHIVLHNNKRGLETSYMIFGEGAEVFPKTIFGSPCPYKDNDNICYIPEQAQEFLEIRYNNYNNYLPIRCRFNEFYNGLEKLREKGKLL